MGVGPFAFRYQRNGLTPCQYLDTTRKAIDCATTLLLIVYIWWNFAADFLSFIVEIAQKTTNLDNLSPSWGSYGRRRTLVDGSLESTRVEFLLSAIELVFISYGWGAKRQNVSKLAAFRRGWVSFSQDFRGKELSPCQYIDTTRKAIDCATTLLLTVYIWWNFTADFSSFIVETCMKDDIFRHLIPILRKLGAA